MREINSYNSYQHKNWNKRSEAPDKNKESNYITSVRACFIENINDSKDH